MLLVIGGTNGTIADRCTECYECHNICMYLQVAGSALATGHKQRRTCKNVSKNRKIKIVSAQFTWTI